MYNSTIHFFTFSECSRDGGIFGLSAKAPGALDEAESANDTVHKLTA